MLGIFGLPVFAQGKAGIITLVYPTGGFLIGFMACAYLVGRLAETPDLTWPKAMGIALLGLTVTYVIGLVGFLFSFAYVLQKPMTWQQAVLITVVPFVPFDIIKAGTAAFLGVKVRQALKRTGLVLNRSNY